MKKVTINFSREEFLELSRQLYLADLIIAKDKQYPNMQLARSLIEKINALGFRYCNQQGHYEPDTNGGSSHKITSQQVDSLSSMIDYYNEVIIRDQELVEKLAERDLEEMGNPLPVDDKPENNKRFVRELNYATEFTIHGIKNLRVIKFGPDSTS